jgi:hypothetical protein
MEVCYRADIVWIGVCYLGWRWSPLKEIMHDYTLLRESFSRSLNAA